MTQPTSKARGIWDPFLIFLGSWFFFLWNLQYPIKRNFDEFHYVPSAMQFLAGTENQNWEHPPLGKLIMAIGIAMLGDNPWGWRSMSTVFGALTLSGMYVLARLLFASRISALWCTLLTLFNQLLYVQARIGMLDTFLFGFLIWAMVLFVWTWSPLPAGFPNSDPIALVQVKHRIWALMGCGTLLGVCTAIKWFGVIPWALIASLVALGWLLAPIASSGSRDKASHLARTKNKNGTGKKGAKKGLPKGVGAHPLPSGGVQNLGSTGDNPANSSWLPEGLYHYLRPWHWGLAFVVLPSLAYALTFLPFYFQNPELGIADFFSMQTRMYSGQLRVLSAHPYMSQWWEWPLLTRPIWYAFDKEANGSMVRGVLLLGNPLVMWAGLVTLLACGWGWYKERTRTPFFILVFYLAFYLCWLVIPRKIAFYYYYYPAGMMLSFALTYAFNTGDPDFLPGFAQRFLDRRFPKFLDRYPGLRRCNWTQWLFLGSVIVIFWYFFPILSGQLIPSESFRKWMWFTRWI